LALSAPVETVSTCVVAMDGRFSCFKRCVSQDTEARRGDGLGLLVATQVAGAVGIEPTTFGFGDRRSAN
jgi:hypothetical protein